MKRFMTILVIAAIALLAITAIAQAATSISVTGTAHRTKLGYTAGQVCTFTWFLNTVGVNNDDNEFISTANYYTEESVTDSQLFTNFTGTGLDGAYTRPTADDSSPWSGIVAGDDSDVNYLSILVGSDSGSMGMTVNGQNLNYVELSGILTREGFSSFTYSGNYTDPSSYFAKFSGTYGFQSGASLIIYDTSDNRNHFAPTSLTISGGSPVPEPGTILAAMSILGPAAMIFRRRKSA